MNILDIIFILIFLYIFMRSIYRGFILSLANVLSFVAGLYIFKTYFVSINTWIQDGAIGQFIMSTLRGSDLYKNLSMPDTGILMFVDNIKNSIKEFNLPPSLESFFIGKIDLVPSSSIGEYIYGVILQVITGIITVIIIVIITNIFAIIIISIAKITKKIPIIQSADRLGGGILGILKGGIIIILIYLVIIGIYVLDPDLSLKFGDNSVALADILNKSYIAEFLNKSKLINTIFSFFK